MDIIHTNRNDLTKIFELFERSIDYQEKKGYPVWRNYDREIVLKDLENRNQYKLVIHSTIAIAFSVRYADKIIWRDLDKGDSIYLHRIVVNPDCKGQRLFGVILNWAKQQAVTRKLASIRMDTWAANPTIMDYYKSFGFAFVEKYTTPDSLELPLHNRNLELALLEYRL
jgi:hypothetical protein